MNYLSVCSGIEASTVAWHHMGWKPVGFSEIEKFPSQVLAHHYPQVTNFGDMTKYKEWKLDDSIGLLVGGTPCQSFSVAGLRKGLDDQEGILPLPMLEFLTSLDPSGAFGKTCQVSLVQAKEGILVHSSGRWANSGMGGPIGCLMLNTLESHKDADECLLSDVLEIGNLPQKYYLSPTACQGILRRAEARGKILPTALQKALQATVATTQQEAKETL